MYTRNNQIFMAEKIMSLTEARKKIFQIANEVQDPDTRFILTENGKAKAIVMSIDEFESWKETFEVMYEIPNLKEEIEEADREYKRGDYVTLEELLEKEGLVIKDGNVSTRPNKKSKKKPTKA